MSENPMSEKQLNFAVNLVIERAGLLGIDPTPTSASEFIFAKQANYTSADASQLINMLLAVKVTKQADPKTESALNTAGIVNPLRVIPNRFAKPCQVCGHDVAPATGLACQLSNSKWVTIHQDGLCSDEVKDGSQLHRHMESFVNDAVAEWSVIDESSEYYFALTSHTGNNDLDFYGLVKSHRKSGAVWVLKRVVGGSLSDSDLTGNSPVMSLTEAKRVITTVGDFNHDEWKSAQMIFANSLGRCFCCGRTLTDDHSREVGMGSVCEAKYGGGSQESLDLW
jgi:hypothetical protein